LGETSKTAARAYRTAGVTKVFETESYFLVQIHAKGY